MMNKRRIWPWIVLGVLVIVAMVRFLIIEPFQMPSSSMFPSIQPNDHFLVNHLATHPGRGDIVVFRYAKDPKRDYVKRVIGIAGDTIEWTNSELRVAGKVVKHSEKKGACSYVDPSEEGGAIAHHECSYVTEELGGKSYTIIHEKNHRPTSYAPVTVPAESYYVVGDNRDNSADSRHFGFVTQDQVKGTFWRVWYRPGP
jgi:signal peptidase I